MNSSVDSELNAPWPSHSPLTIQSRIYSHSRFERIDTPSGAFIRTVHNVRVVRDLPTKTTVSTSSSCWPARCYISGTVVSLVVRNLTTSLFSDSSWSVADLPDSGECVSLPLAQAEQMAEVYNWSMEIGIWRDLLRG